MLYRRFVLIVAEVLFFVSGVCCVSLGFVLIKDGSDGLVPSFFVFFLSFIIFDQMLRSHQKKLWRLDEFIR